jgi:uncharacterized protein
LNSRSIRMVKPEIRVIGIDDGKFVPHSKTQVTVVGVVFRGGLWLDGVLSTTITVDGLDATNKLSSMITQSPHYGQLRVIMINGITLGGFNIVDIHELNASTDLPVIAVIDRKPDLEEVQLALKRLPNNSERWAAVLNAGELFGVSTRQGKSPVYLEIAGIGKAQAEEIVKLTATRSKIPEPLRVAHLVASGISLYST